MEEEIKINRKWIERLIELSEQLQKMEVGKKLVTKEPEFWGSISHIMGYIQSAKSFLTPK